MVIIVFYSSVFKFEIPVFVCGDPYLRGCEIAKNGQGEERIGWKVILSENKVTGSKVKARCFLKWPVLISGSMVSAYLIVFIDAAG